MGLFDKVLETGVKGLDKAKDLGEKGKAKVQITSLEMDLKKIYEEVGADIFTAHPAFVQDAYADAWAKYQEINEKIEAIKKETEA